MPSGSDFKYSTGDTTAWKSKYYAFVDYALSVGASVADIEAFLAENSSFVPGTAPTALASLNAVTATTSDNLEYQISHATPYTSLTTNLWFLVRMPTANGGAMTLKVDALAAKSVYVGGVAMAGGELAAGGAYFFAYNATADRFDVVGATGSPVKSVTLDDTDSVYTLLSSDLGGVHTVAVDISAGNVDVKELALGAMSGIVRLVVKDWDGVGQSHKARLLDSADTEIWTGYAAGDFIDLAYDGSTRAILDEAVTAEGHLILDSDFNQSTSPGDMYRASTSWTLHHNIGGLYDATTNYRLNLPFDCMIEFNAVADMDNAHDAYFKVRANDGTEYLHIDEADKTRRLQTFLVTGKSYINFHAAGNGGTITFYGDGTLKECNVGWRIIRRLR